MRVPWAPPWILPLLIPLLACRPSGSAASGSGSGGVATAFDSTADTVFARVRGTVPEASVRTLVEEMRIAPGVEDTTLFTEVSEFDVDRAGRLWVFDRPSSSILLFDSAGKLLRRIGRQGAGPGEFKGINGMTVLGDTGLAIWDAQNARISFFTATGEFRTSWVVSSGFYTFNGLQTDRTGALYLKMPVTASRQGEILGRMGLVRLKSGGAFGDSLAPPDLPVGGEPYVAESKQNGRVTGRSSMNSSFAPVFFWVWHPGGFFVVGHGGNYEIVLARTGMKPLTIARELPGVPISEEERGEERERILFSMRMTDPSWSWSGPPIPESKAPLRDVLIARDGRIWAQVSAPSERIPEPELVIPRDKRRPISHFRMPPVYEVFAPDGHFLGRVAFPRRTWLMEADGDAVWALGRDENDLPAVIRFRIQPALR